MKHLLNGVAIAAVLALAAPALAQNAPMTPSTPPAAAPAPATSAPMKMPMAKKPMVHHMAMKRHWVGGGDKMTEQLNAQELARITGGAPPPAPAPMPNNYQTPGKSDIPPAPGNMAPPPPAK
jgi:hypothetical protein